MRSPRRCSPQRLPTSGGRDADLCLRRSTAVVGPLAAFVEPHSYDLCEQHARGLTAPRGWEWVRHDGEFDPPPRSVDDLVAVAEAVRRSRPCDPRARGAGGDRRAGRTTWTPRVIPAVPLTNDPVVRSGSARPRPCSVHRGHLAMRKVTDRRSEALRVDRSGLFDQEPDVVLPGRLNLGPEGRRWRASSRLAQRAMSIAVAGRIARRPRNAAHSVRDLARCAELSARRCHHAAQRLYIGETARASARSSASAADSLRLGPRAVGRVVTSTRRGSPRE